MKDPLIDDDLRSVQKARSLSKIARKAYEEYSTYSQKDVDRIVSDMKDAGVEASERLARLAVKETGYGNIKDKVVKNLFATRNVYASIKDLKTVGVVKRDLKRKIIEIAHPMGVVAAITPTTNPTSTVMFKALICAKSRNAVVFAPHPNASDCSREASMVMSEAARSAGAPDGLISCLDTVTIEGTEELMADKNVSIILATGGLGMVKAAHSFGKPAIGVGPGNVPVYVDRSANITKAAKDIIISKTFDNGVICSSDQAIVVHRDINGEFNRIIKGMGGHFLSSEEIIRAGDILVRGNVMNPEMVGKAPKIIADAAGISIPGTARLLIAPLEGVGPRYPLSREILSPIVAYYVKDDWEEACKLCLEILNFGGLGHTMVIHSTDEEVVTSFAHEKPVFRILLNTTASQGAIGLTTSLIPSMTLSTGSWGGGIYTDNISAHHLLNIKRVAYETDPINDDMGDIEVERKSPGSISKSQVEDIVRRIVKNLDL